MVGAVIVTHGRELLDEAKRIVGRTKGICPFLSAGCWLCE